LEELLKMHSYSIDSYERKFTYFAIAILSIFAAWTFSQATKFPWWIDSPSVFGFYGILYKIHDKYLWKLKILKKATFVKIPNLNGSWKGYITTSFDEHAKKLNAKLNISQNWTSICVVLETENSQSCSIAANIISKDPCLKILGYEYLNEPKPSATKTMHTHRGYARIRILDNEKTLEGEYFTGRDRQNFGTLEFKRI